MSTIDDQSTQPRFAFGRNWRRFLEHLDDRRIDEAVSSLGEMLGVESLEGRTFLDIGSGSGLSSLAAMRLGASRVHSFDFDPDSVGCTEELRRRYFEGDPRWTVERGDATDPGYVGGLGEFDVVYSWGVLHHTGKMWSGIENACGAVGPDGLLWLALYNDRGLRSGYWAAIKRTYSRFAFLRPIMIAGWVAWSAVKLTAYNLIRGRPLEAFRFWTRTGGRGMTGWHDLIDWLGGYPYEVATPEEVFEFCRRHGFELQTLKTVNTLGNNEWVFVRVGSGTQTRG